MSTTRYQEGSVERVKRAKGPDMWVYRYRQTIDGKRLHRGRVLGTVKELKSKAEANELPRISARRSTQRRLARRK